MELEVLEQEKQPTLSRTAITARVFFTQETPTRIAVLDALATKLKADKEALVIAQINTSFGDSSARISARLYEDKEMMKRLERDNLLEKHQAEEKSEEDSE